MIPRQKLFRVAGGSVSSFSSDVGVFSPNAFSGGVWPLGTVDMGRVGVEPRWGRVGVEPRRLSDSAPSICSIAEGVPLPLPGMSIGGVGPLLSASGDCTTAVYDKNKERGTNPTKDDENEERKEENAEHITRCNELISTLQRTHQHPPPPPPPPLCLHPFLYKEQKYKQKEISFPPLALALSLSAIATVQHYEVLLLLCHSHDDGRNHPARAVQQNLGCICC